MNTFEPFLEGSAELINRELEWLIPESGRGPKELRQAIRWSLFAGGKRFRPAILFAVGKHFDIAAERLVRTASAIEMLHTYSLIHDDLPSMDNDDLRRGRETCHKRFGEATAILAGDALQALAFQTIAEDDSLDDATRSKLVSGLGKAAASMVVGQKLDLLFEGQKISVEQLEEVHSNKTGALIEFSAAAAAVIGEVRDSSFSIISEYGKRIGLLYQIIDDLLDVTGSTEILGKTAGKDVAAEKATYPAAIGIEETRNLAEKVKHEAIDIIDALGDNTELLIDLVEYLTLRSN
ncbi:polyprenyl synthetase family protein [Leptolyngbya sp. 7M]|uniref:polyprenyl synthetase family protein n=1 Tax=Leptolyngbya sp. 7M TaxID=2812896 RepID=UPI001B8D2CDF|nr:farnesyl diphosphate synthase [Leptolyngbya sp. 7M]QYO64357.1 polyprenyl synthetase family protein [Leptolyngbya sp. 7M]